MTTGEENLESAASATEVAAEAPAKPKLTYDLVIADVGPCKKHLKVSIPKTEIERQFGESLGEMTKEAHVPGFRPGHAPKSLVQKKFRKEVAGQVKSILLMTALEQIEEEHKLNLISQPQLDVEAITLPEDGPLFFELEVEVRPDFEVPDYTNLTVKRSVRTIGETDVDKGLMTFRERYAEIVPKFEGGAVEGDIVIADLVFKDGDRELNTAKATQFRLQPELRFQDGRIPAIGEALAGAKSGDVRTTEAAIGTSSADPALRGRTIQAEIHVLDVKTYRLPEIDPGFLLGIGFDDEDQLRQAIRATLERRLEFQQREIVRRDVLDQLLAKTPIDLPPDLVARQERDVYRRQLYDLRESGLSDAQIRAREAEIRANAHEETLKTLKEFFLLAKVAEKEGIKVDDADLEREIEAIAERTDETVRRVRARVQKDNLSDSMATQILERKALEHILRHVNFVDVVIEEEKPVETLDQNLSALPAPAEEEPVAEAPAAEAEAESAS